MKLINCYVSSFGNLKDFSYDFNGGLNTVKEENGWGKSTFAAFIKAMFYGLSGSSKREIDDNERKRFAPWNSTEKFGGSVTFLWDGKEYKIERFFGQKATDDTVKLFDVATGKFFTEGKAVEDLGKRIFSIDEDGFLSTTYFSQKDFEIKSNTSITAKFNEVCEVEESDAFDKAMASLDGKIKELKQQRGDKGRIAEIKREILAIEDDAERTRQAVKTVDGLKRDLEIVKAESQKLSEKMKEIAAKLETAGKKEAVLERKKRYDSLNAELSELKTEISRARAVLCGKDVAENEIRDCEKCIRDLYGVSAKIQTLKVDVEQYAPKENAENSLKENSKRLINGLMVSSVISAILGVVLTVTTGLWGIAFIVLGAMLGVYAVVKISAAKAKDLNERQGNAQLKEIYERKKRDIASLEETESQLIKGLDGYFSGFAVLGANSYEEKLNAIKDAATKVSDCDKKAQKIKAEIDELVSLGITADVKMGESVTELNDTLKLTAEWYRQKAAEGERIKTRIDALEASGDSLADAESKKAELKEELIECEKQLKILTLTAEFMRTADENLKIKYRAPLQESLNKYLKLIAGKDLSASIDTDMNITVKASGAERETDFFSKGYRNLFEICKRFALTDILFTAEKPFIILDDPFYNLDDEKVTDALSLIKKLSAEYQILYLVCHESRRA